MKTNKEIKIFPVEIRGKLGIDLNIKSDKATIQDYIISMEEALLAHNLHRSRNNSVTSCEGCQHCCNERIPLTSVDVLQIIRYLNKNSTDNLISGIREFILKYGYVIVDGPSIDIILRLNDQGICTFLNKENKCAIYPARPLVCRTFFCCPVTKKAAKLRETIVNTGEDELSRLWLREAFSKGAQITVDEAYDACINPDDWQENTFTNRESYSEIKIKALSKETSF